MRNKNIIANIFSFLAEYRLRGRKAFTWRVMAEWLKTPSIVFSKHLSCNRLDSCWKIVGTPINPTKDAYCNNIQVRTCINSNEGDYTAYTKTTNI